MVVEAAGLLLPIVELQVVRVVVDLTLVMVVVVQVIHLQQLLLKDRLGVVLVVLVHLNMEVVVEAVLGVLIMDMEVAVVPGVIDLQLLEKALVDPLLQSNLLLVPK